MNLNGNRILLALLLIAATACGDEGGAPAAGGSSGHRGGPGGGGAAAAVPVEVTAASRQTISSFIETNGTLEAENEVDLVARVSAPILALHVEEGDLVKAGQLLARLDDQETRVQTEIARVGLAEMRQAYERAQQLHAEDLISSEAYERATSAYDAARAQLKASEIQLEFTELRAPFAGRIVRRYVDLAEQVSVNTPVYRLSDFDPLLCPIQMPERDLSRVRLGQHAWLSVEAWGDERFTATVLRISPIIEAETGTFKVTLELRHGGRLRPGMFARVFVETETREGALVVPKAALSLESIGDTVYVAADGKASRREVELGFRQGDLVEIVRGVSEGEQIVVVGQDGLSEGTPLQILGGAPEEPAHGDTETPLPVRANAQVPASPEPSGEFNKGGRGGRPDFANMTDEQLEQVKVRMRSMGMTDEQIEERIKRRSETAANAE
jgi:RND family efflux transporter MFP subunit